MGYRKALSAALVGGLMLAGAGTAAAAPPTAQVVYLNTVVTQWSHWTPDPYPASHAGTLYAGSNYFKCWVLGEPYSDNNRGSAYWLRTDDDSGNANVYVSEVYLDDYGWNNDKKLLKQC